MLSLRIFEGILFLILIFKATSTVGEISMQAGQKQEELKLKLPVQLETVYNDFDDFVRTLPYPLMYTQVDDTAPNLSFEQYSSPIMPKAMEQFQKFQQYQQGQRRGQQRERKRQRERQHQRKLQLQRQTATENGNILTAKEIAMEILSDSHPFYTKTFIDDFEKGRREQQQQEQEQQLLQKLYKKQEKEQEQQQHQHQEQEQEQNERHQSYLKDSFEILKRHPNFRSTKSSGEFQTHKQSKHSKAKNYNWQNSNNFESNTPVRNDDTWSTMHDALFLNNIVSESSSEQAPHVAAIDVESSENAENSVNTENVENIETATNEQLEDNANTKLLLPRRTMKRAPMPIAIDQLRFAQPHYPVALFRIQSNDANQGNVHSSNKRERSHNLQRIHFLPSISAGAMTNLGHFFNDLTRNVQFNEQNDLGDDEAKLLQGDHPLDKAAQFSYSLSNYRPSSRIKNLVSMNPQGYQGSNFLDPNYMWIGMG